MQREAEVDAIVTGGPRNAPSRRQSRGCGRRPEAKEVEIGLNVDAKIGYRNAIADCVSLTFAEVGDAIVAALKQRIATMKANLRHLGVE
jgi:hypothetical protein